MILALFVLEFTPTATRHYLDDMDYANAFGREQVRDERTTKRADSLELRVQIAASQYGLTKREAEVLLALVQGRSKGYVADILMISRETVRTHTQHVYQKLGVHSREELMSKMLDE